MAGFNLNIIESIIQINFALNMMSVNLILNILCFTIFFNLIGRPIGRCLTKMRGQFWCYVSSDSECADKKESLRQKSLRWSSEAFGT